MGAKAFIPFKPSDDFLYEFAKLLQIYDLTIAWVEEDQHGYGIYLKPQQCEMGDDREIEGVTEYED